MVNWTKNKNETKKKAYTLLYTQRATIYIDIHQRLQPNVIEFSTKKSRHGTVDILSKNVSNSNARMRDRRDESDEKSKLK